MNKVIGIGLLLLLCYQTGFSQGNTVAADRDVSEKAEQWLKEQLENGYLPRDLQAWHVHTEQIDLNAAAYQSVAKSSGVVLFIPKDYQVLWKNGNRYMKLYLFNLTDSTLTIPRMDATVNNIVDLVKIDHKWVYLRRAHAAECGNSYWKDQLEPFYYQLMQVDNSFIATGTIELDYKIAFELSNGHVIESNVAKAFFSKNQIKKLKEKNILLDIKLNPSPNNPDEQK